MPPTYYRGCWHVVSRGFLLWYSPFSSHKTEVYNPKTVFPHAASLGQGCPHCPIFPTAASRRSLGRVSVPMWPFNLSVRLPIAGLVGYYLTNYLIGRESILLRIAPLVMRSCGRLTLCGISTGFPVLSPSEGQVTHALLTRSPLTKRELALFWSVRLACVRRAASVHPEPGSNSLKIGISTLFRAFISMSQSNLLGVAGNTMALCSNSFKKGFALHLRCSIFKVHAGF